MKATTITIFTISLLSLGLASCATVSSSPVASEATPEAYEKSRTTKGVVILAVNWGRAWGCGGYENAELLSFGFDRLPLKEVASNGPSEVFIDGPPRLMKAPLTVTLLTAFQACSIGSVGSYGCCKPDGLKTTC